LEDVGVGYFAGAVLKHPTLENTVVDYVAGAVPRRPALEDVDVGYVDGAALKHPTLEDVVAEYVAGASLMWTTGAASSAMTTTAELLGCRHNVLVVAAPPTSSVGRDGDASALAPDSYSSVSSEDAQTGLSAAHLHVVGQAEDYWEAPFAEVVVEQRALMAVRLPA